MPDNRRLARFGARFLAAAVGLAVFGGALGGATLIPWPSVETVPPSTVVAPKPSEQQRVCPGGLYAVAEDSSQARAATSVGPAAAVYGARARPDDPADLAANASELAAVDDTSGGTGTAPLLLTVPVADDATTPPLVAGSQSQTAATETLGGLAVAACAEARSDSWIVGGSTDVGRTSLLLLSNPTTVLATVDLSVFGETGPVDAPGATGILVQPGEQRIVSLAGLAPNVKSPVVHVESSGGQVAATLQQSRIRGIEPGGVELLGASSGPALDQVIAGLQVTTPPTRGAAGITVEGFPEDTPSVRVLVPGDESATVDVGVTSATGGAAGDSVQVEIEPGIATEIPFPALVPGSYSVELTSDQPIVTGARTATEGTTQDFAWYAASDVLAESFLVSVAAGPAPTLHLVNTSPEAATLTVTPETGAAVTVTVPADSPARFALVAGARYLFTGATGIVASVGYSGNGELSSFPLNPAGPLALPIRVYGH